MHTSSACVSIWLILAACVACTIGCNKPPQERAIELLTEPGKVIVFAVEPPPTQSIKNLPQDLEALIPEAVRQRRVVTGFAKVDGAQATTLKGLIHHGILQQSRVDEVLQCVGGSHAIAISDGSSNYFYLFTFECFWVEVFVNGAPAASFPISDLPKSSLEQAINSTPNKL